MDLRIAIKVVYADDGEEVFTRFVKPERLMQELQVIIDQKSWKVAETYIANSYGQKIDTKGGEA